MRSAPRAPTAWAVAGVAAFFASLGLIGADALWLVPLGGEVAHGHLPGSIPWATAQTSGWHDVPAVGELLFWAAWHLFGGYRGLLVAQVVAAAIGFWALARGLQEEAPAGAVLAVSAVVLVGGLASIVVVENALYSLALFPLLLWLIESESRHPSNRIWLAVPLIAVWGNLHGAVLAGWALLGCYLLLDRARRSARTAIGIFVTATLALFLNPTLWYTPAYYRGVLASEAARQGVGLWAPLRLEGVDLLVVVAAFVLIATGARAIGHVRLWEAVAITGLAVATVHAARTAPWLLFVAAYPAVRALRLPLSPRPARIIALVFGATAILLLVRQPTPGSASLARLAAATDEPVLADAVVGQQVALDGGRVWVENPIDAFQPSEQRVYLAWVDGRTEGAAALNHADYVLVSAGSAADRIAAHEPRLILVAKTETGALYRVRRIRHH